MDELKLTEIHLTILEQLMKGACCRVHLHRETGLIPYVNRSNDQRFDFPLYELMYYGLVKQAGDIGEFMIYKITNDGKAYLRSLQNNSPNSSENE
jgi:hypothetical protein